MTITITANNLVFSNDTHVGRVTGKTPIYKDATFYTPYNSHKVSCDVYRNGKITKDFEAFVNKIIA